MSVDSVHTSRNKMCPARSANSSISLQASSSSRNTLNCENNDWGEEIDDIVHEPVPDDDKGSDDDSDNEEDNNALFNLDWIL